MKLAIAAFGTALVLATGASAMIGPYERAVNDPATAEQLSTTGAGAYDRIQSDSASPEGDWANGEDKKLTVFPASNTADDTDHFGVNAR